MGELTFQDPKKKFCEELKAAREYKNLDISRVAEKTKIAQHYLEHLESGDWGFLPHAYVRAFLRTYAQVVGLEVGKVLDQFDNIVDEPAIPTPGVNQIEDRIRQREKEKKKVAKPKKKEEKPEEKKPLKFTLAGESQPEVKKDEGANSSNSMMWLIIMVAAVIVVAVVYFWPESTPSDVVEEIPFNEVYEEHQNIVNNNDDNQTQTPTEVDSDPVSSQTQDPVVEEPVETFAQEEELLPPVELRLHVEAIGKCYIRVLTDMDTDPISDIVLENGMTRNYRADSLFTVVLGNAGAMKIFLGDEDLGELGEVGRVVTLTIDKDGIRQTRLGVLRPPVEDNPPINMDNVDLTRPVGEPRESVNDEPVTFEETPPDTVDVEE